MAELWQHVVESLRKRPVLWLPVLLADLLCFLVGLGRSGLLKAIVLHNTAQQSVLGGAVTHGPMTASAMQSTTILAVLLSWLAYFVRLLLYSGAFVITAALVQAYQARTPKPMSVIMPALTRLRGGMLELALRALAVYALAALLLSWATSSLLKHGQTALVQSLWLNFSMGLLVALLLAALLAPVALRVLSGRAPRPELTRQAQYFSMILMAVATLLSTFVAANGRELTRTPPGARYPLEVIGSLVVALPYVLLFTGIALLARQSAAMELDSDGPA